MLTYHLPIRVETQGLFRLRLSSGQAHGSCEVGPSHPGTAKAAVELRPRSGVLAAVRASASEVRAARPCPGTAGARAEDGSGGNESQRNKVTKWSGNFLFSGRGCSGSGVTEYFFLGG